MCIIGWDGVKMTIRPVDLQVLIPRVTEVSKMQHAADHQDTLQQQQFEGKWQQIGTQRQHKVQNTTKNADNKVGEKHAKEQNHSKNEKKNPDDKQGKDDTEKLNHPSHEDPVRGNLIDIKT